MSFIPNRLRAEKLASYTAWPSMDSLYDYRQAVMVKNPKTGRYVEKSDKPLGKVPRRKLGQKVAVVGGGPGGVAAAYELMKMGFDPVIFEATDRLGGRNDSQPFLEADGTPTTALAEMGAMRFPVVNKLLYHYFDLLDIETTPDFPDPGVVLTELYYEDRPYLWKPADGDQRNPPPGPFEKIAEDWNEFLATLTEPLALAYRSGDLERVEKVWQEYIDRYRDVSFYAAVREGIPQWTDEDLNAFGALGVGSGGFGPLYQVGFLEMLRILLGQYEQEQRLVPGGISQLVHGLYARRVETPRGERSLLEMRAARLGTAVQGIRYRQEDGNGNPVLTYLEPHTGEVVDEEFRAVIVAISTRAMEFAGMTLPTLPARSENGDPDDGEVETGDDGAETSAPRPEILQQPVREALRNLHLMNSSKMFIRTRSKFWLEDPTLPANIQTDEAPRGIYCLDYPGTDNGVVLISYTWGDDSSKLLSLPPEQRFRLFKAIIQRIHPGFARHLEPVDGQVYNVDWEAVRFQHGAFKLNYPGQEPDAHDAYFQFLTALSPQDDRGVYLAGDAVSWYGGWTEGALETALNAAAAAAHRLGAKLPDDSPLSQDPNRYSY